MHSLRALKLEIIWLLSVIIFTEENVISLEIHWGCMCKKYDINIFPEEKEIWNILKMLLEW